MSEGLKDSTFLGHCGWNWASQPPTGLDIMSSKSIW